MYLVGDTHGVFHAIRLCDYIPKGQDIIHMGDIGLGFYPLKRDLNDLQVLADDLARRNQRLFIVRGNHDNPAFWNEGLASKLRNSERLIFLPEFARAKTAAQSIIFVNGGVSIDRVERIPLISYWKDEITPDIPENLKPADIVIAHDAPSYFNHPTDTLPDKYPFYVARDRSLMAESYAQREKLDRVAEIVKPKRWYSGHYHNSMVQEKNGIRYQALGINEIIKINTNA